MQDILATCERGDEHNERALRQVEVRNERVERLKPVARIDENLRPRGLFTERAVGLHERFDRTAGRCADADDTVAALMRFVEKLRRLGAHHAELAVQMMVRDLLGLHGAERAESHMERHICKVHALLLELFQKLLRKMKAGCRRSSRAVRS